MKAPIATIYIMNYVILRIHLSKVAEKGIKRIKLT